MDAWERWQARLFERVGVLESADFTPDADTRERLCLVMIDNIAAMISALQEPPVQRLSASRLARSGEGQASAVTGHRMDAPSAALVNAVAGSWNEVDEGYRPATCHAGLYTLPAVMAEVEHRNGRISDVFRSLLAGYEVATAYARAFSPPKPLRVHPHATLSTLAAASGLATLGGDGAPSLSEVVPVAVSMAMIGTFEHAPRGLLMRNAWAGQGAIAGFNALDFANAQLLSDSNEIRRLFENVLGFPINEDELHATRESWAVLDGYHKPYACCQYIHSAVEATYQITSQASGRIRPESVQRVVVRTHPLAMNLVDTHPTTDLGAKFSVPHCVASVLTFASTDPSTFSARHLDNDDVRRVRSLVDVVPLDAVGPPPHDRPAEVTVELIDGTSATSLCLSARGGPDRPLGRDEILAKAEGLTSGLRPRFVSGAQALLNGEVDDAASWTTFLELCGLRGQE